MAHPIKPSTHWWPVFRAALLTCLLLFLTGLLGQAISPVKTIVSITFDDGYADQYAANASLLLHGMPATYYIITDKIGQAGYLSWEQLQKMQSEGMEIGGHTLSHPYLTQLHGFDLRHEICDSRVALIQHGLNVTSFAYSYGLHNAETDQAVFNCGYNSGRGLGGRLETIPPKNLYSLRTWDPIQADTTPTQLRGYIKQAERSGGGWVQLLFHHVCNHCDKYAITPLEFSKFLDWLRLREANGTVVRTIGVVIGGAIKPPIPASP